MLLRNERPSVEVANDVFFQIAAYGSEKMTKLLLDTKFFTDISVRRRINGFAVRESARSVNRRDRGMTVQYFDLI